jgi:tetratricopeptide (TPR) repeat protein
VPPENGQIGAAASPEASPTEVPPPYDIGSVQPSPPVSDQPLTPLIDAAAKDQPAFSASLRFVERARKELDASKADEAIRALGRAVSIDSSDPYAYFYLGRAYMMKNDYGQALAFFGRSEVGLRAIPAWLGEVKSFEGACLEQQGKFPEALQAYKDALEAAPNNLMARVGYGRLSAVAADANAGNEPPPLAPAVGAAFPPPAPGALAPPPEDSTAVAGPPKEAPPAPAQSDPGPLGQTPDQPGAN